ncbi:MULTISPECIES: YbaK/EbsC family protein [Rhizobium]|jgi:prolyl-tRNA editing enzyme YbaK/EbsC (Cys-tRNA(Pro) deacylase)|uniref:YbaK/EbsC family protein n=1 Tax=Rhizobium tropici TaxID=398 RepID=A0A329YLQ6_RHITR|nr:MULTISPECIES: YbaK/EbsC family protein [Rhizobium]MBB3288779.1 prolyl-tRNA editing enzyme YbaK/EbsC (Cys-tRNA(Pro) deacylase) [Rhizobium sp. BK252]MBB3403521.1 prolyl-tRNA editing enzyme YbaK/EbsC (Cys-tRNA(Pro) deacylase) [Rhizobium sp. BK289]MBB3416294.1 prolyl-tRNA editing enzyme YbaK/EbsC (Cys-tRNA(Pro) deacylase) [Rhizobium sp. BK284]MBB3483984.1 prolyl-tRNA editing enzyme YbaK/EbsC (Cys-tRNA(Pro) deacylase) [Rhizobium sp. BK347]MDK4720351.1 YbaK/EbsC family protein [Rhizobium sp. CNPS
MSEDSRKLSSLERVELAASNLGLDIAIKRMEQSTRTAEEAAKAVGCAVGQIVKSLVFVNADTHELTLLLVSGSHNADTAYIATTYGVRLKRADIDRVRDETGFAIGGVAPIGHLVDLPVFMDQSLLAYDQVWCAAGRPDSIFACNPALLAEKIAAMTIRIKAN